jgi:hypothetical protein
MSEPVASELLFEHVAVPPMSRSVMASITGSEDLRAVLAAYHSPQVTGPCPPPYTGRHFRVCENVSLIVTDEGKIIGRRHQIHIGSPGLTRTVPTPRRQRRGKGGSGTRIPTSFEELRARLDAIGAQPRRDGRHLCVTLPNGQPYVLPRTPSDWRSLRNAVAMLRRLGLDVLRPA